MLKAFVVSNNTCFVNEILYTYVVHERAIDSFKPDRKNMNVLEQDITSRLRSVRYILRHSKNESEKFYALNFYFPETIIKQFTFYAKRQNKSRYDKQIRFLKHKKVREILLSTLKIINIAPQITFKAFMLQFFPNLYYFSRRLC